MRSGCCECFYQNQRSLAWRIISLRDHLDAYPYSMHAHILSELPSSRSPEVDGTHLSVPKYSLELCGETGSGCLRACLAFAHH